MNNYKDLFVWGYVQKTVPSCVPFVLHDSYCSLETACDYMHADSAVFMNSTHNINDLCPDLLHYLDGRNVVCGLTHGAYKECAEKVSLMSLQFPNITGAIIDDFLDEHGRYKGPSAGMTPQELKEIRDALRKHNPDLKLYVVRYTRQDPKDLIPYLPYFDVLNLWVWCSTKNYWIANYRDTIAELIELYDKPIMQGLFIHHYGFSNFGESPAMDLDLLETQCERISMELHLGNVNSFCILQNGWFSEITHRKQVQFVKDFVDWHYGTTTDRR